MREAAEAGLLSPLKWRFPLGDGKPKRGSKNTRIPDGCGPKSKRRTGKAGCGLLRKGWRRRRLSWHLRNPLLRKRWSSFLSSCLRVDWILFLSFSRKDYEVTVSEYAAFLQQAYGELQAVVELAKQARYGRSCEAKGYAAPVAT